MVCIQMAQLSLYDSWPQKAGSKGAWDSTPHFSCIYRPLLSCVTVPCQLTCGSACPFVYQLCWVTFFWRGVNKHSFTSVRHTGHTTGVLSIQVYLSNQWVSLFCLQVREWLQGIPGKPSQHGCWIVTTGSLGSPCTRSRFTAKSLRRNYSVLLP